MSLFPFLRHGNWWDSRDYSPRLLDQHFGMGLMDSDLLSPTLFRGYLLRPRSQCNVERSGSSEVQDDSDRFRVLNVSHFGPEEISVKAVDGAVIVHGKHEEKSDEHGFVSREFTRRYALPEGADPDTVVSSMSANGVLTVEAPKKQLEPPPAQERHVPIILQQPSELKN